MTTHEPVAPGPGWSGPLTIELCAVLADSMRALRGRGQRYREEYRNGDYQHSIPGMVLPSWLAPEDCIRAMQRGEIHALQFTTMHNVRFEFFTHEDVTVALTDRSVKITRVQDTDIETLECIVQGMPISRV